MASSSGLAPPVAYDSDDEPIFMPSEEEKAAYQRIARQRWTSGGSLIRIADPDKATQAKVPDVAAAPSAIPEAVADVLVAEQARDFPQLGNGSAGWLGGRLLAATLGTIDLNLSVLDQVRMEPMHWPAAAGLQCDRSFHARRVLPSPVYVQSAQPGCGGCSNQMVQCQHAPVPGVQPLLSVASRCKQRRSARLRAPVEPAAERQRQARALVEWAEQKRINRAKKLRRAAKKASAIEAPAQSSERRSKGGGTKRQRRTSHAYHRTPHGPYRSKLAYAERASEAACSSLRSRLRAMLGELQRGRSRAGAVRALARTVSAATRAAGAVFLFTLSQLITPAASLPLLNSHGTRKRPASCSPLLDLPTSPYLTTAAVATLAAVKGGGGGGGGGVGGASWITPR
jgi:hypothetical protein